jgi:nitrogen fixation protein NifT
MKKRWLLPEDSQKTCVYTYRESMMKVMIRKDSKGTLTAYVAKKDLEEPIVAMDNPAMWGGLVTLANGWQLELPAMPADTPLPITVEARRLASSVTQ